MIIYVILVFCFSAIFDTMLETTAISQIEDQIREATRGLTDVRDVAEIERFREMMRETLYHAYYLDVPQWQRIFLRGFDVLTFDFGESMMMKSKVTQTKDVWQIVVETIPNTVLLFTTAIFCDVILGLLLGLKKAQRAGGIMDKGTSIITMAVYGIPTWWFAMVTIWIFAYVFKILPSGGIHSTPVPTGISYYLDVLKHLALPVITLVLIGFWGRAYLTRNIVLSTLQEDYIMAARARGIPERNVLYGHTMRSAAPPIMTMAVLSLLVSVSGAIITEGVFSWSGMGRLYWSAIEMNDIPVLMGNICITTALYIAGLVFLDLIYGLLDPRIRVMGRR